MLTYVSVYWNLSFPVLGIRESQKLFKATVLFGQNLNAEQSV